MIVSVTRTPSTRFNVSVTGSAGTAASAPLRTAAITASNSTADASGRAASCATAMSIVAGKAARPARTESERVAPPGTAACTGAPSHSTSGGSTTTTIAAHAA